MKKKKIRKTDILLVKSFLEHPESKFVRELSLEMDVDYLSGLCFRFIANDLFLHHKLIDLDAETKRKINIYINEHGSGDDILFYLKMKASYLTLCQYYDEHGYRRKE